MARKIEESAEDNWKSMTMAMSAADWASLRDDEIRVVCDGSHVVCAVWGGKDDDEVKAAHLIAAAPQLYEPVYGLLGLLKLIEHRGDIPTDLLEVIHNGHRTVDARKGLAKAEGRTQPV